MFRALIFLFKAGLFIAAVAFLAHAPGKVEVEWRGWLIETSVGFVLAVTLVLGFVWTMMYRFWRALVAMPDVFRRYRAMARREKGYRALTRGLVAIAAGDGVVSERMANRAGMLVPDVPLTKLLSAQSALLNGNAPRARVEFAALLDDDAAAFLGVRGLLQETMEAGNYQEALALIRRAEKLQPRRRWVLRTLFDLEVRNRDWNKALATLKKAEKNGVFDAAEAKRFRQAILAALGMEAETHKDTLRAVRAYDAAFALDPAFLPAAILLARLYQKSGRRRAAMKLVMKAWEAHPHPDLGEIWISFRPENRKLKTPYDVGRDAYAFARTLFDINPAHRDGHRMMGKAALHAVMWKEARAHLLEALDYKTLALLERLETGSEAKSREWLETAAENPPDPRWICTSCGHAAAFWEPLCTHCHAFDAHEWMIPSADIRELGPVRDFNAHDVISPPKALRAGF